MNFLSAAPGMVTAFVSVLVIDLCSIGLLCIGVICYHSIVMSRRMLLSSLHQDGKKTVRAPMGILAWVYALSTFLIVLCTAAIFMWQPILP